VENSQNWAAYWDEGETWVKASWLCAIMMM
jgi:hypothetical protein